MVIARASNDKNEILFLGITRENIRRLQLDQPIRIRRSTHGDGIPEGWEIVIVFGETERSIHAEFEKSHLIGPETKIHIDPRLGQQ
jgi:hypothetical protein